ncbi:hypothetical protein TorRG33x02_212740 [Trema orientale]|uniref:Uncharacterized protein n=1 Tax=Trema orientale TaxID=63057 RepID=A0A2P5EBP8_TREOI|nr:hypothetical protein TorRG33x02_212740 [Trema orientale]
MKVIFRECLLLTKLNLAALHSSIAVSAYNASRGLLLYLLVFLGFSVGIEKSIAVSAYNASTGLLLYLLVFLGFLAGIKVHHLSIHSFAVSAYNASTGIVSAGLLRILGWDRDVATNRVYQGKL